MITVRLVKLSKYAKPLGLFLETNLRKHVQVKGSDIHVDMNSRKILRETIRKYLHQQHLDDYRIIRGDEDILQVLPPAKPYHKTVKTIRASGISPYSPYRVEPFTTVEFPNYPPAPARKFKQQPQKR